MERLARSSYIAIARIIRPRGNKGEVLAELHTDFPERFRRLDEVWLEFPDNRRERRRLESSWAHKGRQVLKLSGSDSISAAEELVGAWVEVELDQAVSLPEGTYFDHDLIGCSVCNLQGEQLGAVSAVLRVAGNNQLVIQTGGGEFLIPAAPGICKEVSISEKRIVVDLPEGLVDLNK